jgi:hypothetical protein
MILKKHLRVLRRVRRFPSTYSALTRRFGKPLVDSLLSSGRIRAEYAAEYDEDGFPVGDIPGSASCVLTEQGFSDVESKDWFDLQYLITHVVAPIVIGVASAIITRLIS